MAGIPPALETDSEDVAWALQTAEALWKRNERGDAIVWLRRAAQAAADIDDDDRALALARDAAELTEWTAQRRRVSNAPVPPVAASGAFVAEVHRRPASFEEVTLPELSVDSDVEMVGPPERGALAHALRKLASAKEAAQRSHARPGAPADRPAPFVQPAPVSRGSLSRPPGPGASSSRVPVVPRFRSPPPLLPSVALAPPPPVSKRSPPPPVPSAPPPSVDVPTAAEVHAGMLDPWAEGERSSPGTHAQAPPRSPSAGALDPDEIVTSAPPVVRPATSSAGFPSPSRTVAAPSAVAPAIRIAQAIELSAIEALGDLPDEERDALGRSATVRDLAPGEQVSGFALALLIEGSADVTAVTVDAPALRLHKGAVLRGRGTIEEANPLRLVASSARARIGTWSQQDIAAAFRSCPWVEDELRLAGDRVQALVGATMGRLGERLDAALRDQVTSRLSLRALAGHEVFARAGEPISGLLVVGAGHLELLNPDGTTHQGALRPGDFLFPTEVLRAAATPYDVRAAWGGAIVLVADRALAQELLVTCPPLLEIFASLS